VSSLTPPKQEPQVCRVCGCVVDPGQGVETAEGHVHFECATDGPLEVPDDDEEES
jgi:hypothetical protein